MNARSRAATAWAAVAVAGLAVASWVGPAAVGAGEDPSRPPHTQADSVAAELDQRLTDHIGPLLRKYCLDCHSGDRPKGDIALDALASVRDALAFGDDLDMVREMVATKEMPPEDEAQPSEHERLLVLQWLDAAREYVPPDAKVDPGWATIHRLNRTEYRNTLRDLLGIDPRKEDLAAKLPRDDTGYGFDNIADVLSVSPLAIEGYVEAAERAVELALGPELEFGDRPESVAPLEGANGRPLPGGGHFLVSNGAVSGRHDFPAAGEYLVRFTAWETPGGDERAKVSLRIGGQEFGRFEVSGTRDEPQDFEARVRVKAGRRTVAVQFLNDFWQPDVADRNLAVEAISVAGPLEESTTERAAAWKRVFAPGMGEPDETTRVAKVLGAFAERAYRRPLEDAEARALSERYRLVRATGLSEEGAARVVLTSVLVSPQFLFRAVAMPAGADAMEVRRLGGYELASRLSYFLWSSMPDDELLARAADGSLAEDATLKAQARRLLADPRADAFIENFTGQWLQLRALDTLAIDTARFPEYDESLRAAMRAEATMMFADVARNDRSVLELLRSDRTFVNDLLARYYGLNGVEGSEFRPVTLPADSPRGGVLTMGGVLTVTSNPTRTSPVKRGLFVLEQILGAPPPPPPADIPPLEQAANLPPDATLRQQLAAHVANPTCAVCHNRLDPLGLALENFDAIGRWRTEEGGKPIDPSGTLPGGIALAGPADLKRVLASRSGEFVETLAGKVLTYAVGRGLEPFDRPTVRAIAEATRAGDDRFGR